MASITFPIKDEVRDDAPNSNPQQIIMSDTRYSAPTAESTKSPLQSNGPFALAQARHMTKTVP